MFPSSPFRIPISAGVGGHVFCILNQGHSEAQVEPTLGETPRGSQDALNSLLLRNQLARGLSVTLPGSLTLELSVGLEGSKHCRTKQIHLWR